jgi:hypothetical protein
VSLNDAKNFCRNCGWRKDHHDFPENDCTFVPDEPSTSIKSAVYINVSDDIVDYRSTNDVDVVLVDWDELNGNDWAVLEENGTITCLTEEVANIATRIELSDIETDLKELYEQRKLDNS